ncbi:hypothetical protein TNCV_2780191 [Trichonephila clavipes]|nr:hypothetical protein TNCV_2780191 [Trichonephila clavipes]
MDIFGPLKTTKVLNNLKEQEASHVELSTRATKQHHYDYKIGSLCFIKTPNIKSNLSPKLRPKFEGNRDYTVMWVRLGSTDLMGGRVMFLRSNQGDRLDGNESVADSFRSDLVGFKSWSGRFLWVFSSLLRLPEKTSSREANSLPGDTPFVTPILNR